MIAVNHARRIGGLPDERTTILHAIARPANY